MASWPRYELDADLATDRLDDSSDYIAVFGAEALKTKPFINIGAGDWQHPLLSNLDFVQPPYDKYIPPRYNVDLGILTPLQIRADQSTWLSRAIPWSTSPPSNCGTGSRRSTASSPLVESSGS